ncbi:hypothetical protein L6Q85_05585 [bacterium]|nr:hypothetical protein [bacterium]NUP93700.1 hypothetical protein [Candidatus Omnitrophota bacterium]
MAESSSSSYGLVVHLLLLPTPPCSDAVAFGYRPESACLKWTYTTPIMYARRRTHSHESGNPENCSDAMDPRFRGDDE